MIVTLLLTVCHVGSMECKTIAATPEQPLSLVSCMVEGQRIGADWISQNGPQWRLHRFACQIGKPRKESAA